MKEYKVMVTETLRKVVTIEAESAQSAREIVDNMYNNEEIVLSADDFDDYSIETL